jgi:hypothetical protein
MPNSVVAGCWGRGEYIGGDVRAPMKRAMKLADLPEDEYRGVVRPPISRVSNDFVPQDTEVALEVGKSVVNVESGEDSQDV